MWKSAFLLVGEFSIAKGLEDRRPKTKEGLNISI